MHDQQPTSSARLPHASSSYILARSRNLHLPVSVAPSCREFRSILKDCYTQDTSQSSRLCFELKRSEAQNLCRAFNGAAARVNLGSGASRPATSAAAIQGSKPASASNAQDSSATSEVSCSPALLHGVLVIKSNGTKSCGHPTVPCCVVRVVSAQPP